MRVRVVKVGSIPFGLSVLVDKRPGSLIVWVLEDEWPDDMLRQLEHVLTAVFVAQGEPATVVSPDLHTV